MTNTTDIAATVYAADRLIALLSEATTLEEINNVRAITYALCRSHHAIIDDNDTGRTR